MPAGYTNELNEDLIESRCVKSPFSGCWDWALFKTWQGYGHVKVKGRTWDAHRASYTIFNGPIPEGLQINHHCDNPSCVNPDHLYAGTSQQNMDDMISRGRKKTKLTKDQALEIYHAKGNQTVLANKYGVSRALIYRIKNRLKWAHIHEEAA